ncbi:hypothetical protein LIER_39525 [Lithospermum erythrorhizon]|uniref:Uncharacterized protein n=1 Tax=Lithospermum erythrorhizon TaxID=34254 RepID=A0AAV3QGA2_LITER
MDKYEHLIGIGTSFVVGTIPIEDAKSDNEKWGGATSVDALLDYVPDSALTVGFPVGEVRSGATSVDVSLVRSPDSVSTVWFSIRKGRGVTISVDAPLDQSLDSFHRQASRRISRGGSTFVDAPLGHASNFVFTDIHFIEEVEVEPHP